MDEELEHRLLLGWVRHTRDDALMLLDTAGTVVCALGAVQSVLGYTPQELVGQSLRRIFTPEDLARGLEAHEMLVARVTGRSQDDRWHLRNDGSRVWVTGSLVSINDEHGQHIGYAKVLRDRTDLRSQIETLEGRIRALEHHHDELRVFLSTTAHELRNPLAPLTNAAYLIRMLDNDGRMGQPVDIIERQLAQMARLVNDMMDVSRLDIGKLELRLQHVELQAAVAKAVDAVRPSAINRGQTIELLRPIVPIMIELDAGRFEQIVVNLVNNAIKYTPEGGRILVQATVESDEAVVRVTDNGMGIAPDMLPRIFELFTQESRTSEAAGGGLGIGLALVKNLVHAHHGVVEVRSEGANKGSEFTVRLPLRQPPPPARG